MAQVFPGKLPDIAAVNRNPPRIHIIKAHEQVDESGFSRPGRPYNRHKLAGLRLQIQIPDQRLLRQVLKIHMLKPHIALRLFNGVSHLLRRLLLFVQQAEHPLCRCERRLDIICDIAQICDWLRKHLGIHDKGCNIPQGNRAGEHIAPARHADQDIANIINKAQQRHDRAGDKLRPSADEIQFVVDIVKLFNRVFLVPKDLDDIMARIHLFNMAVQFTHVIPLAPEIPPGPAGYQQGDDQTGRQHRNCDERHAPADIKHHSQHGNQHHGRG